MPHSELVYYNIVHQRLVHERFQTKPEISSHRQNTLCCTVDVSV